MKSINLLRHNNFINWSEYQHYLTSCDTIWEKSNAEINQVFGINTEKIGDNSFNAFIEQWDLENILQEQKQFDHQKYLAIQNTSWAVSAQFKIYTHEREIFSTQFSKFYRNKLQQSKKTFAVVENQTITTNFLKQELLDKTTMKLIRKDILYFSPKIFSRKKVRALPNIVYWSAAKKKWTIINLFTKKKLQLLDVHKVMYNYLTFKEIIESSKEQHNINSEVYLLADSDIKNQICFKQVENFLFVKKTAKSIHELDKAANKTHHQSLQNQEEWSKIYLNAIRALQTTVLDKTNNLVYSKSKCNGKIKKCFYFPICKQKYLVKTNPLLTFNQLVLVNNVRNNLDYFSNKEVNLNSEKLFKSEFCYLATQTEEVTFDQKEIKHFFDEKINNGKKKIVWFDFETFMSTIPFTNNPLIKSQTPFQASIINTDLFGNVLNVTNLIKSPKNINTQFFKKIVDSIYCKNAVYVVYNKATECSILVAIKKQFFFSDSETAKKIDCIVKNANLIDLMLPFKSVNNNSPIVRIKSIKGSYGLKFVFNFINKWYPIFTQKAGACSYHDLNVMNGFTATIWAKQIAHNLITKSEWQNVKKNLKKYCENDVRAMISIFLFLQSIIKNKL